MEWFEGTATVSSGRNGVLISRYVDGRATGDAFVLFDTEEEATKALKKDRESMGNRYIVLFLCPFVELQKVKCLSLIEFIRLSIVSNKVTGSEYH